MSFAPAPAAAPTVSVIMPVFNGAGLIGETIASLQAQHFGDFEVVIVDDCSTDATREVLAAIGDPRLRVIATPENGGPVRARNRAMAEARGHYIAALDADDLCLPERLARQVAYLDANPDVVLVGGSAAVLDDGVVRPSRLTSNSTPALIEWLLQISNPLVWSSVMFRAEAARTLNPFTRPERVYAEDFDFYHRLMPLGRIGRIDADLLIYRSHAEGISKRFAERMHGAAQAVLADAHRDLFGAEAEARADLIVAHVMNRRPVADRATLAKLGETLMTIQRHFFATRAPDREERKQIRWQTARLWGEIGRASIRAGAIGVADAVAVRPDHLGMGYNRLDNLAVAQAIGGVRALIRRR